jgi:hypothetical protein
VEEARSGMIVRVAASAVYILDLIDLSFLRKQS